MEKGTYRVESIADYHPSHANAALHHATSAADVLQLMELQASALTHWRQAPSARRAAQRAGQGPTPAHLVRVMH